MYLIKGVLAAALVKVKSILGLDADVIATLVFRVWSILTGAVMVLFVPIWLTPVEQGYYYTFTSFLALQLFFELGLNYVVTQLVSHDYARLVHSNSTERSRYTDRLASLVILLRRWYAIAAFLFTVFVGSTGFYFFSAEDGLSTSSWAGAWVLLTLATAINLYLSALLAVLEGCGQIALVARVRLRQSVIGYICMWCGFCLGYGLWAMPLVPLAAAACTSWWLMYRGYKINQFIAASPSPQLSTGSIKWKTDIFPMQWRIAVSWISGYFLFQLFTPLAFSHQGAKAAGQLGITLAVFTALSTVSMSWISAKNPLMAAHIARGEREELNVLFRGVLIRTVGFVSFCVCLAVFALLVARWGGLALVSRFSSIDVVLCLALATVINLVVYALASYMRAHREEPMLLASVVSAVAVAVSTYYGVKHSVLWMVLGYLSITVFLSLPWTVVIFFRFYNRRVA